MSCTHLRTHLLIRWRCAPGAKHKGGVSSALYVCSHFGFPLIRASSSMLLIAPHTLSLCNGECICVFQSMRVLQRERTRGERNNYGYSCRWKSVCVCKCVRACVLVGVRDQPNKLHGCSLSRSHFYRSGVQPLTSETKGNIESSSKDR